MNVSRPGDGWHDKRAVIFNLYNAEIDMLLKIIFEYTRIYILVIKITKFTKKLALIVLLNIYYKVSYSIFDTKIAKQ